MGVIEGWAYHDHNDDLNFDDGEPGISGARLTLVQRDSGEVSLLFTDPTGFFRFAELAPGAYVLSEAPPAGWLPPRPVGSLIVYVAANYDLSLFFAHQPQPTPNPSPFRMYLPQLLHL